MHTIRISMSLRVNWNDKRVSVIAGAQSIYLSTKDQKRIWSPSIAITSNKISLKIEEEEFILKKKSDDPTYSTFAIDNGAIASKNYISVTTLVKCEMNFQIFPFDQHTCKLEVCIR